MNSLQCFKDKEKLVRELLTTKHNTEKVVYFLLLDRKLRNPCCEDDEDIKAKSESTDPPRKRIDSVQLNGQPKISLGKLSEGSPVAPRRALTVTQVRKNSLQNTSPVGSPLASPHPLPKATSLKSTPSDVSVGSTPPGSPSSLTAPATPWRTRLHTIKNSFLGSPRFHRRKFQVSTNEDITVAPDSSQDLTKRSWFGALMGTEKEEHHFVMIKDKPMSQIKADLVHSFLCTPDLSHNVIAPSSFRAEYRRSGGSSMFSRNVKFQVDISPQGASTTGANGSGNTEAGPKIHCVTFTLISGPSRRFKRICELLQSLLLSSNRGAVMTGRRISADLVSDTSSSSSYSSMDRVSPTPPDDVSNILRNIRPAQIIANGKKALLEGDESQDTKV